MLDALLTKSQLIAENDNSHTELDNSCVGKQAKDSRPSKSKQDCVIVFS